VSVLQAEAQLKVSVLQAEAQLKVSVLQAEAQIKVSVLQAEAQLQPETRTPLQPNHIESPAHNEPRTIRPMW